MKRKEKNAQTDWYLEARESLSERELERESELNGKLEREAK